MKDPDEIDFSLRMCKTIAAMPKEVQDRFKALKVLMDQAEEFDEEEDNEYRELELKYEALFKEVYEQRRKIVVGEIGASQDLVSEFDSRAADLNDEDFKKVEVEACDVKDFQNTPTGVYGFWFKAMLNHKTIGATIQEKDRPILMMLQDIQCELHKEGFGFDLVFKFEQNDYFTNTELKKTFLMTKQNIIEKCQGTDILWKEGRDVTKKKIKKKNKGKKGGAKTQTKIVDCESFFNFFKSHEMPNEEALKEKKEGEAEEEEKELGERMDMDYDLGNDFKDQLIPLALEYYMGVIEDEDDDEDDMDEDDEDGGKGDSDSDEDDKKTSKKKKGKKGGDAQGGD